MIIFTATILGAILAIALITTMVCCFKKKKRSEERAPKVDTNEDYGLYYSTAGIHNEIYKFKKLMFHDFDMSCSKGIGLMKEPWR